MKITSAKRSVIALSWGQGCIQSSCWQQTKGRNATRLKLRNEDEIALTSLSSFSKYDRETATHYLLESKRFGPKLGRNTQRHSHTGTQTHRDTHTQAHRHTETHIHRDTQRDTHRHKHTHTHTDTYTHTDTQTHTHTHTHTRGLNTDSAYKIQWNILSFSFWLVLPLWSLGPPTFLKKKKKRHILLVIYKPHVLCPFVCWWASRLALYCDFWGQCCSKHEVCTSLMVCWRNPWGVDPWNMWIMQLSFLFLNPLWGIFTFLQGLWVTFLPAVHSNVFLLTLRTELGVICFADDKPID